MKVLVATDGSENAMKAVYRALDMAQAREAEVTIMAVAYSLSNYPDDMPAIFQEKLESEAQAALKKAADIFTEKNIKVKWVLETGQVPANNIVNFAEEGNFDRIVIGRTGIHTLKATLMGSTASKVVALAPCEVTVVV